MRKTKVGNIDILIDPEPEMIFLNPSRSEVEIYLKEAFHNAIKPTDQAPSIIENQEEQGRYIIS